MLKLTIITLILLTLAESEYFLKKWTFHFANSSKEYPANIPSTLTQDLIFNNITKKDTYYRDNILQYYQYETQDVIYKTNFSIPSACKDAKFQKLVFQGLDTHCDVYLNNKKILTAHNMFRKYEIDVEIQEQNSLQVRFNSSANYDLAQQKLFQDKYGFVLPQNFSFSRKPSYQYGWDWGPRILTVGIWKNVGLKCYNHISIESVFLQHQPITKGIKSVKSNITAHVKDLNPDYRYRMTVKFIQTKKQITTDIEAGMKEIKKTLSFEESQNLQDMIWWTNDLGKPNLFQFQTTISCLNVTHNISVITESAFKTITLKQEQDSTGKSFTLNLNGYDLFIRGGNYIPPEMSMANVPLSKYQETRKNAEFGRFNMIRVWGGGQFQHDEFYGEMDRAGILIWHDLMFACALYPIFSEGSSTEDIKQEMRDNVLRIRNHPSIGLWNGNNQVWIGWQEWGWKNNKTQTQKQLVETMYKQIFQEALPEVLNQLTPTIPYWQTSPSVSSNSLKNIGEGDIHFWRVWGGGTPIQEYEDYVGRFNSEYGMQSMPTYSSILKFTNSSDRTIGSFVLQLHERHPMGDKYLPMYTESYAGKAQNLKTFSYFSQVMQAYAFQTAIRSLRGAKPICMGSLYWQMNDVWPVSSWATVDYYNCYKASHYRIRNLHNLLFIHAVFDKQKRRYNIYIVNDGTQNQFTFSVIEVLSFEGAVIRHHKVEKTVVAFEKETIFRFQEEQFKEINKNNAFINMKVKSASGQENENNYFFVKPSERQIINPSLSMTANDTIIEVTATKAMANYVWVKLKNETSYNFEDNYFDLAAGQTKQIKNTQKFDLSNLEVTCYQNQRMKSNLKNIEISNLQYE